MYVMLWCNTGALCVDDKKQKPRDEEKNTRNLSPGYVWNFSTNDASKTVACEG